MAFLIIIIFLNFFPGQMSSPSEVKKGQVNHEPQNSL